MSDDHDVEFNLRAQTSKYLEFVKGLIKYDPKLYLHFDNSAKFILESDLQSELKALSMHNVAMIYKTLDLKQPNVWSIGNAETVISFEYLLRDTNRYLKTMHNLFSTNASDGVTIEEIYKAIDDLAKKSSIVLEDLIGPEGVISSFKVFLETTTMSTREKDIYMRIFSDSLTIAINEVLGYSESNILLEKASEYFQFGTSKTPFLSILTISNYANLHPLLIRLNDGQLVEGEMEMNDLKQINFDGSCNYLSSKDYLSYTSINPISNQTNIKLEFDSRTLHSYLLFKEVNPSKYDEIVETISESSNLYSDIQVFAVSTAVADLRIKRIKQCVSGRSHETFENSGQVDYLKSISNSVVVCEARPNSEHDFFEVLCLIKSTGRFFTVNSFEVFVFLDSNNRSRQINFDKKEDRDLFIQKVLKSSDFEVKEINNVDWATMKRAVNVFRTFKSNIRKQISSELNSLGIVNISEFFYTQYCLSIRVDTTQTRLDELLERNIQFSNLLKVVIFDNNEKIISSKMRKLPVILGEENGVISFESFLDNNEKIEIIDETGITHYFSDQDFYKYKLKTKSNLLSEIIDNCKDRRKYLNNFWRDYLLNSLKRTKFIIEFDKKWNPRSAEFVVSKEQFLDLGLFVKWILDLHEIIREPDYTKRISAIALFKQQFCFNLNKATIIADLEIEEGELQLVIYQEEPGKTETFFSEITNVRRQLCLKVSIESVINQTSEFIKNILNGSLRIKRKFPEMQSLDFNFSSDIMDFINYLDFRYEEETLEDDETWNFIAGLNDTRGLFSIQLEQLMRDLVVKLERENFLLYSRLCHSLKWNDGCFLSGLLINPGNGSTYPGISIKDSNLDLKNRYYRNVKNWQVILSSKPYVFADSRKEI